MTMKNYRSMLMDAISMRGVGVVVMGLALPTASAYLSQYVPSAVKNLYARIPYHEHSAMKAAVMVGSTAAIAFAAQAMLPMVTYNDAVMATGVAAALVAVSLAQQYLPAGMPGAGLLAQLPTASALDGYGGYYGYLGSAHGDDAALYGGHDQALYGSHDDSALFGVKTNVF
tara:strand:- start:13510 stop:14022 length:513 start_codon:yes stop_codon:yes gene_type:complete